MLHPGMPENCRTPTITAGLPGKMQTKRITSNSHIMSLVSCKSRPTRLPTLVITAPSVHQMGDFNAFGFCRPLALYGDCAKQSALISSSSSVTCDNVLLLKYLFSRRLYDVRCAFHVNFVCEV